MGKPVIAVVSPSLDKRHGTERCLAEQIAHLAHDYGYHVYLFSQTVDDVILLEWQKSRSSGYHTGGGAVQSSQPEPGSIIWKRIPCLPGPHLLNYSWWFIANHLWRWRSRHGAGIRFDLIYSPGVNCLDADVILVHIVYAQFSDQVKSSLSFVRNPVAFWPRIVNRWLYYHLIIALERVTYSRKAVMLAAISRRTALELSSRYGCKSDIPVIYHGLDLNRFQPLLRARLRCDARHALRLPADAFAILLVGNDWKNKGLACLLQAVIEHGRSQWWVLIVGKDDQAPYESLLAQPELQGRVLFLPIRADVEYYYAAADAYVGPSLDDAFALPPLEAMACGLPVIASSKAGVSEIITDNVDALILKDPRDVGELGGLIRRIYDDRDLRERLGANAVHTAQAYTWDRNAAEIHALCQAAIQQKLLRNR